MAPEEFFFSEQFPDQYLFLCLNNNFPFQNSAYPAKPLPIPAPLSINRAPLLQSVFQSKFLMCYPHPKDTDLKPSCPYHKSQTASHNPHPARHSSPASKAGRKEGFGGSKQRHSPAIKQRK